jgi:hypothetical protein
MRIDKRTFSAGNMPDSCNCIRLQVEQLLKFLEDLQIDLDSAESPSVQVRKGFTTWAVPRGWKLNTLLPGIEQTSISQANYKILGVYQAAESNCALKHRIYFHCMFDNRQSIGTNLLRLRIAKENGNLNGFSSIKVIGLVVDGGSRGKLGWDNSVGCYEEYFMALTAAYKGFFNEELDLWAIRGQ